jgi:glutamate dehydrogenase
MVPGQLPQELQAVFERKKTALQQQSVPEALACKVASCQFLVPVVSFIGIANATGRKLGSVFDVYYELGELLRLNWLGEVINGLDTANYWEALARESFLDDLAWQQRTLTCNVINSSSRQSNASKLVEAWAERHPDSIRRTEAMLTSLHAEPRPDYSMLSVALRELLNLAQSTGAGKAA